MRTEGKERIAWVVDDIGGRTYMEDDHCLVIGLPWDAGSILAGVFDGHGGIATARLAAMRFPILLDECIESGQTPERAVETSFLAVDREASSLASGAVGIACLVGGRRATFANVGDAELLLVSRTSHRVLTEMHRLSNGSERSRVINAGASISGSYVMLPDGRGLQCTRSFGDIEFREVGIIPNPFVGSIALAEDNLWLIAACDGLWDVMDYGDVAAVAKKKSTARVVAEALYHEAVVVRRTQDNLTVIVIDANPRELAGKA